jgi:hypothetical protein
MGGWVGGLHTCAWCLSVWSRACMCLFLIQSPPPPHPPPTHTQSPSRSMSLSRMLMHIPQTKSSKETLKSSKESLRHTLTRLHTGEPHKRQRGSEFRRQTTTVPGILFRESCPVCGWTLSTARQTQIGGQWRVNFRAGELCKFISAKFGMTQQLPMSRILFVHRLLVSWGTCCNRASRTCACVTGRCQYQQEGKSLL